MHHRTFFAVFIALVSYVFTTQAAEQPKPLEKPLAVGDKAKEFTLQEGEKKFSLKQQLEKGSVVLIVLRGFPGYQCPVCLRQVDDYLGKAEEFAKLGAQVVMIYPGDVDNLQLRADQFLGKRKPPEHFHYLIDPGYKFTNLYALRWDKKRETAYPSTFVFDGEGITKLAVVSRTHRGRTKAADALKVLRELAAGAATISTEPKD